MISVVINTFNEEKNLKRAINSVSWADEVLVCDMFSIDKTVIIAKDLGVKVVYYQYSGFVEPARNFAISKAKNDWILILDADEEVPVKLAEKLKEFSQGAALSIPRKNIIFGKWVKSANFWPDFNIRFFKKDKVKWSEKIHSKPEVSGTSLELPIEEELAIVHHHYSSISQFLERLNRYTNIQASELVKEGYQFRWTDLISRPVREFLSRYFANFGYRDGLHGLALSLLQSFSEIVLILKVWELEGFKEKEIDLQDLKSNFKKAGKDLNYWLTEVSLSKNFAIKTLQKVRRRLF